MRTTSARFGILLAASTLGLHNLLPAQNKDPYLITRAEIEKNQDLKTAYDVIQKLRPRFFRATRASAGSPGAVSTMPRDATPDEQARSDSRSEGILVVVNGSRRGTINELKQIDATLLESVRYIKGPDAVSIYGYEQAGVIEIVLVMGRTP